MSGGEMIIDTLEPEFKKKVLLVIEETEKATGLKWSCVQGRRTIKYQDALYAQPTDGIDNDRDGKIDEPDEKVTRAKGGQSAHNFGLAADLVPLKNGKEWWNVPRAIMLIMAKIAEKQGLVAGIRWTELFPPDGDMFHIQDPNWKQAQAAWLAGKLEVT